MTRKLEGTFIGFCGAGGTGKTATAELLAKQINYVFLPSSAREAFKELGYSRETDQDRLGPTERWILQRNIQTIQLHKVSDFFDQLVVTDRTQVDQHAYALQYCSSTLQETDLQWLHSLVNRALQYYKHIFYFPLVTFPGHNDGMRTSRYAERLTFDLILRGLLERYEVPYTKVPIMDLKDRVEFIIAHLPPPKAT